MLHTHQTWALALNMLKNNRLVPASQTAAFFHGHVAYDDTYAGTADAIPITAWIVNQLALRSLTNARCSIWRTRSRERLRRRAISASVCS